MRNSFKTIGVSLVSIFCTATWAGQVCEKSLTPRVDISQPANLTPLQESGLGPLQKRVESHVFTQKLTGETISVPVRFLKGIRNTGIRVERGTVEIGWLGKTQRGRYVVLQKTSSMEDELQRQLWSSYHLNRLAQKKLAVPVWGLTKIYEEHFWVRPLVFGSSPFSGLEKTELNGTAQQVIDLADLREDLKSLFPQFVQGFHLPQGATEIGDPDEVAAKIDTGFVHSLRAFLEYGGFVANTQNGHLQIEELPLDIKGASSPISFYLDRWSWYRYLLLLKLSDREQGKLYDHMRQTKSSVEMVLQTEQLSRFLNQSPYFIIESFENSDQPLDFVVDNLKPFARPATVQFKDKSKLKYHYKKHAAEFAVTSAEDYMKEAEKFVLAAPSEDRHYLLRANGDILLVDLETDVLAVFTTTGLLRTFMKATVDFHKHPLNLYYFLELALREEKFFDESAP